MFVRELGLHGHKSEGSVEFGQAPSIVNTPTACEILNSVFTHDRKNVQPRSFRSSGEV